MANLTHTDTAWTSTSPVVTPSATKQQTVTLSTAGKYVDKDIKVLVDQVSLDTAKQVAGNAVLGASATGSATISSVTVGAKASGSYPLTGSASITGTASASTTTSGYATAGTTAKTGSTTGTASLNASIAAGALNATPSVTDVTKGSASMAATTFTQGDSTSPYYATLSTTAGSAKAKADASVKTAGYVKDETATATSDATTVGVNGNGTKLYIKPGALGNAATTGVTYTENEADNTVIPANGSLYLDEGYYPATKITLAHIIPDPETGKANAGAAQMRSGYVAYDGDGNKIVGTMADVSLSHSVSSTGSASGITLGTAQTSAPTSGAYITVTGSDSVNTTGTGYITKLGTNATKSATNYYPVSITAAQAKDLVGTGAAAVTSSQSISVTNVAGSGTPVKNETSGKYEISVSGSGSKTINGKITSTGYVTKDDAITGASVSVSASGKATVDAGTITNNTTGGTSAGTINAGKQIKISAGYYPSDTYYTAQSASDTTAGTITATGSASTVTVTGASIGAYNASTNTVDVTTTNTIAGTATGTGATAGYITTSTTSGAKSFTTTGKTATFSMNAYDGSYTVS